MDFADNCPRISNPNQVLPGNGSGCNSDTDQDNVSDGLDNCPLLANSVQSDMDGDQTGDACDPDRDGDSVPNAADNCPNVANRAQEDADRDSMGDACDQTPRLSDGGTCF